MMLIVLTLCFLGAAGGGYAIGAAGRRDAGLKRAERKRLRALEDLVHTIETQAYQNYNLPGESFPTIVIGEITKRKAEIR